MSERFAEVEAARLRYRDRKNALADKNMLLQQKIVDCQDGVITADACVSAMHAICIEASP